MCAIIDFQVFKNLRSIFKNTNTSFLSYIKYFSSTNRCIRWCTVTGTGQVRSCRLKNYGLLITDRFNVPNKSISHFYYLWPCIDSFPTFTLLELNWGQKKFYCLFFCCKLKALRIPNIDGLLFIFKRSFICCYIIYMTVFLK